jgi:hypothetical protein
MAAEPLSTRRLRPERENRSGDDRGENEFLPFHVTSGPGKSQRRCHAGGMAVRR